MGGVRMSYSHGWILHGGPLRENAPHELGVHTLLAI